VGSGRVGGRDVQEGVGILELEMLRTFGNEENGNGSRCWRTVMDLWHSQVGNQLSLLFLKNSLVLLYCLMLTLSKSAGFSLQPTIVTTPQ